VYGYGYGSAGGG